MAQGEEIRIEKGDGSVRKDRSLVKNGPLAEHSERSSLKLSSPNVAEADLSELFQRLTLMISRSVSINKGVLIVQQDGTEQLAAVSTWDHGTIRDGLSLTLPRESSLFSQVASDGQTHRRIGTDDFSGNFFERKLLLDDKSRSFILHPLKSEGRIVGLVGYSSHEAADFTCITDGRFDEATSTLADLVERRH